MAESVFQPVEITLPVEEFHLTRQFNECKSSKRVNLSAGAYRDESGKPWVLPVVRAVEIQMAKDETLNHEHLPVSGLPDFRKAATELMLGKNHKVVMENKAIGFQAIGGTGCLKLAAAFLKNVLKYDVVYVSNPSWENYKGVFRSAGFTQIREYRYWSNEIRDLNFVEMCEDLTNAPANSVVIFHAVAHNPTGVDPTKEQWKKIFEICKEQNLFVLMDCAFQGFASGDIDNDAWSVRYFAEQGIDMMIVQSLSKNFGLYNERVGNLIVVSKDEKKLPEIISQMEIQIRIMWSNPPNHGARIVATILNNKTLFQEWTRQLMTMAKRIKQMRFELFKNLQLLATPGKWAHIVEQIGIYSYTGLTEKQVKHLKEKSVFLLSSGCISMTGITSKNVAYVAEIIDEAIRANPILSLSESAGEPAIGTKKYFLEFAKRKLSHVEYNVIKTSVVVEGTISRVDESVEADEIISVESFVKVKMVGSLSSVSTIEMESSQHSVCNEESIEQVEDIFDESLAEAGDEEEGSLKEANSTSTQPGTLRSSVKTFKTRSMQTLQVNEIQDLYQPKSIPARFEGTMLTPVYFDGLMFSPEKLDKMLLDAAKKGGDSAIPVKFQGGMLTAAFKTMAENLGFGSEPVNVKFQGKLQGLTENEAGIPIAFDGSMIPKQKGAKAKN